MRGESEDFGKTLNFSANEDVGWNISFTHVISLNLQSTSWRLLNHSSLTFEAWSQIILKIEINS